MWRAALARDEDDAGTADRSNLNVNTDGNGLDTASGRPNDVVSLASLPVQGPRRMSADSGEGDASVDLPVTPD